MPSCDEPHPPSLRSYDTVAAAAAAAVAAGAPSHRAGVVSVGVGVGARDLGAIERAIERACVRGRSARTCGRVGLGELLSAVACALLSGMVSRSNGFIYTRRDSTQRSASSANPIADLIKDRCLLMASASISRSASPRGQQPLAVFGRVPTTGQNVLLPPDYRPRTTAASTAQQQHARAQPALPHLTIDD